MFAKADPDNSLVVLVRALPRGSRSKKHGVRDGRLRIKTFWILDSAVLPSWLAEVTLKP